MALDLQPHVDKNFLPACVVDWSSWIRKSQARPLAEVLDEPDPGGASGKLARSMAFDIPLTFHPGAAACSVGGNVPRSRIAAHH